MLIYGRNSHSLLRGQISGHCGTCNNDVDFAYQISSHYGYFFFIPTFHIGTKIKVICPFCKTIYKESELDRAFVKEIKDAHPDKLKIPIWHWTGLLVFSVLIYLLAASISQDRKREHEYFLKPKVGDCYEIQIEKPQNKQLNCTVIKIDSITSTGIRFLQSKYVSDIAGLDSIEKREDAFYIKSGFKVVQFLTFAKLDSMNKQGTIIHIKRK